MAGRRTSDELQRFGIMKTLAIIVNYKVAELAVKAAGSILKSESDGPLRVVIVDNSESEIEAERLKRLSPDGVHILVNQKNAGFGRASNIAFEKFPSDCVLLLNPDARLTPGCLEQLQRTLMRSEKTGAVGPLVFWDDHLQYYLPPSYPPFLHLLQPGLGSLGNKMHINAALSNALRRRALNVWRSRSPVRTSCLSGGHMMLKTDAVISAGGLFDEQFFMYFEDTDLCIRLKNAGYWMYVDPRAKVVHYFDQSARQNPETKSACMEASHRCFARKYQVKTLRRVNRLLQKMAGVSGDSAFTPTFDSPFTVRVPDHMAREWLFEWSPHMDFIPSIGRLGKGPYLNFSEKCWEMLASGRYYGRIGGPGEWAMKYLTFSWVVKN